jgi:hypothetical protein
MGAWAEFLLNAAAGDEAIAAANGHVSRETFTRKYLTPLRRMLNSNDPKTVSEVIEAGRKILEAKNDIDRLINPSAVRIAMTSHISGNYFQAILEKVNGLEISVIGIDRRASELAEAVASGEADLAVGPVFSPSLVRDFSRQTPRFKPLGPKRYSFDAKFVLISSAPLGQNSVTWAWVLDQNWILHERGTATRSVIEKYFSTLRSSASSPKRTNGRAREHDAPSVRIKPEVIAEATDPLLLVHLVSKGERLVHDCRDRTHGGRRDTATLVASGPAIEAKAKLAGLHVCAIDMAKVDTAATRVTVFGKAAKRGAHRHYELINLVALAAEECLTAFLGDGETIQVHDR